MKAKIKLRGFIFDARIGIYDFELAAPQRVALDVDVELLGGEALSGHSDHIEDTVDYDFIRSGVLEMISTQHFNLQETLVRRIYDMCHAQPGVGDVRVYLRKLDVYADCESVGVELSDENP